MKKSAIILGACVLALGGLPLWAQPDDRGMFRGDRPFHRQPMLEHRLERIAEFLELDVAQTDSWRELADQHVATAARRRDRVAQLRAQFRDLAAAATPNPEQAGRVALDLHAEIESGQADRKQLIEDLGAVLTPPQRERFEALQLARELTGRGHRRPGRHFGAGAFGRG